MKKKSLFIILIGLMGSVLGTQLLWTHHEIPKINVDQHKNSNKAQSFYTKPINSISKTNLKPHNLGVSADYNIVAPYIIGIINDNYFGYGWQMTPDGAVDNDFETLWKMIYPNAAGDYNNPGKPATGQELTEALDNYEINNGGAATDALLNESFINDKGLLPPSDQTSYDFSEYLKPDSSFYINMDLNKKNLQNDTTSLHTLAYNNYFGYSFTNTTDPWFSMLFDWPTQANIVVADQSEILANLKAKGDRAKTFIATALKAPGTSTTNLNDLVDNSWLKNNLNSQNTNIAIPAHALYELVENYYFGYSISDTTNPLFSILFSLNTPSSNLNDESTILSGLKAQKEKAFSLLESTFIDTQAKIIDIANLKDGSWLKTELSQQTNKANNDLSTLFTLVQQNYFGYAWGREDYVFNLFFSPSSDAKTPGQSLKTLEDFRSGVLSRYTAPNKTLFYANISNRLKNPGAAISNPTLDDLKDGEDLKLDLQKQANNLSTDATSLFNLVNINYFGYPITLPSNPLFPVLFSGTGNNPVAKTEQDVISKLMSLKGNAYVLISQTIKTPGTFVNDVNQLKDGSWLKTELNIQKTSLITALTTSISKFYDAFKSAFLGKNFNNKSFVDANYVLLFFNSDKNNNLSLGINPSEVANTFANNLITQLKANPNFQFPNSFNKQIGGIQVNNINNWINSLFTINGNGKVTLSGDLANFSAFEKSHLN